jgi:cytochrome c oxidase subunit 3
MSSHAEHFESAERQHESAELGMWVFLATELMFFGPLFLAYAWGRHEFPGGFAAASRHTEVLIGSVNTAVLLTSSLFMALAVRCVHLKDAGAARLFLRLTALLGAVFLALKGFEYYSEWREHLVPWANFEFEPAHRHAAMLFYYLYFGATGLHAVHLSIGIVLMLVFAQRLHARNLQRLQDPIEMGGLYWHFVDSVWVFLYPILYLVERHT